MDRDRRVRVRLDDRILPVALRVAYGILPWGMVAFGALHMTFTWTRYETVSPAAIWFFSAGLPLAIAGLLNLTNRAYGASAPGLRWLCRGTNLGLLVFCTIAGVVTHGSPTEMVVGFFVIGGVTVLSCLASAMVHPAVGRRDT